MFKEGADEKDYVPYLTNKALSYYPDTILYANEMNINHWLPKRPQYDYLLGSVRKKKRRSPWFKEDAERAKLAELVSQQYNLSPRKAREAIPLLTADQIEQIKSAADKGGY